MSKTEELIYKLAEPIALEQGVRVYDVELKKEGQDWFLRVFLYKEDGIAIDDCENVSRKLSDELDREDPIEQAYYLEVSSPGITRELTREWHFLISKGENIDIKLYSPINGKKQLTGELMDYKDGVITIKNEIGETTNIEKSKTAQIKIAF